MEGLTGRKQERERSSDLRKARQVCRQAQRVLSMTLAGECQDELLRELWVEEVLPGPGSSRLLVKVVVPAHVKATAVEVMERLGRAQGLLRRCVAQAITRKRAPELTFVPVLTSVQLEPSTTVSGEGGAP